MIAKLAVLVIEKKDGSVETVAGEKGDIVTLVREEIRAANDNPANDIYRITAFGSIGIIKDRRYKLGTPAPVQSAGSVEDEAKELRRIMKEAGKNYSPNAGIERLREQVAALESEDE